jgi:hypothetical protein
MRTGIGEAIVDVKLKNSERAPLAAKGQTEDAAYEEACKAAYTVAHLSPHVVVRALNDIFPKDFNEKFKEELKAVFQESGKQD